MRLTALSVGLGVVLALLAARASANAVTETHFFVRPDLRLCPSPACGGAWVRRVNHPTTRCADGAVARECYVASVSRVAKPDFGGRAGSFLARGRLVSADLDGFPGLGALTMSATWRPVGKREPRGTTFRVADNGIRCITSPCFSLTGIALERAGRRRLSDLDLARVGATKADLARAAKAVDGRGLLVTGTIRSAPHAGPAGTGRTLVATQLWLPA